MSSTIRKLKLFFITLIMSCSVFTIYAANLPNTDSTSIASFDESSVSEEAHFVFRDSIKVSNDPQQGASTVPFPDCGTTGEGKIVLVTQSMSPQIGQTYVNIGTRAIPKNGYWEIQVLGRSPQWQGLAMVLCFYPGGH